MTPKVVSKTNLICGLVVKNPLTMQETQVIQVQSLDWEDPLEKEMANHFSIPVWKISWTEECGRLQFMRLRRVGHNLVAKMTKL